MSVGFLDLVRVTLSTTGTGSTLTIAAAVAGWLDFTGAGGINGTVYRYAIIDGNNSEIGTATYNSGSNTLAGRTVTKSTNANAPLNLTSAAILAVSIAAEDLVVGGTNYGTMAGQSAAAVAIGSFLTADAALTVNANSASTVAPPTGTNVHVVGAAATANRFTMDSFAAQNVWSVRRANGTIASPTTLTTDQSIATLGAFGYDGTAYSSGAAAAVGLVAGQTWTSGAHGAYLTIQTTPNNSTTLTEVARFWGSGGVSLGADSSIDPGANNLLINGTFFSSSGISIAPVTGLSQAIFAQQFSGASTSVAGVTGFPFYYLGSPYYVWNTVQVQDQLNVTGTHVMAAAFAVGMEVGGANSQGSKFALEASIVCDIAGSNPTQTRDLAAGNFDAYASVNQGGTSTVIGSGAKGTLFAAGLQVTLASGATNFLTVAGGEINVGIQTGASSATRFGLSAVALGNLNAATAYDAGFEVSSFSGAPAFKTALLFSSFHGGPAVTSSGTLIGNDAVATTAGIGIDFSHVDFNAGYFLKGGYTHGGTAGVPNFTVDYLGNIVSTNTLGGTNCTLIGLDNQIMMYFHGQTSGARFIAFASGARMEGVDAINGLMSYQPLGIGGSLLQFYQSGVQYGDIGQTIPGGYTLAPAPASNLSSGVYVPNAIMQTTVGGYLFGNTGVIGGATPTQTSGGGSDTFFAVGFGTTDSTIYPVPYSASTGVLIGNAEVATLYVGSARGGTGDPTPQGCQLGIALGIQKVGATAGAALYGQTGAIFLNVVGGWAGSSCTFTASCTVTNGSNVVTAPAAPTNHRYFVGMAVQGASLVANTSTKGVSGTTLTLTNNWTGSSGTVTLTFVVGTPQTAPGTTPPGNATSVATGYNPLAGDPADCFALNGQVSIYDNGIGAGQWMECIISQFAPGGTTAQYTTRIIDGVTTAGKAAIASGVNFNQIGRIVQFGGSVGVGGCCLAGVGNGRTYDMLASDTGWVLDSSMAPHNVSEPDLKKDIRVLPPALHMLRAVDPVTWLYRDEAYGRNHFVGFLVRDADGVGGVMEGIDDDLLRSIITVQRGDGVGLKQNHMFPVLWKATQEVWAETQHLLDRMNGLEARVSVLEGRQAVH